MIDTDKYEGHTEGPWRVVTHENNEWQEEPPVEGLVLIESPFPCPLTVAVCDNRWQMDDNGLEARLQHSTTGATARQMFNANEQLIADAPLLLEEVKRLREESKKKGDVLTTLDEMIRNYASHVEMMKALEQGLDLPETWKEMIE